MTAAGKGTLHIKYRDLDQLDAVVRKLGDRAKTGGSSLIVTSPLSRNCSSVLPDIVYFAHPTHRGRRRSIHFAGRDPWKCQVPDLMELCRHAGHLGDTRLSGCLRFRNYSLLTGAVSPD